MSWWDEEEYKKACLQAAHEQGLTPVVEILEGAGYSVVLDQTGGFTMCAAVYNADHSVWVWVTPDGSDNFVVGVYTDDQPEGVAFKNDVPLAELPETVRGALAAVAAGRAPPN